MRPYNSSRLTILMSKVLHKKMKAKREDEEEENKRERVHVSKLYIVVVALRFYRDPFPGEVELYVPGFSGITNNQLAPLVARNKRVLD